MGTRVDFYVGRGPEAEWLGSYPWDGYPVGVFGDARELFIKENPDELITEEEWRQFVTDFLTANPDKGTTPEMGWPWPWEDSRTTDYAYALDEGVVWGSCFGHRWFAIDPNAEGWGEIDIEDDESKVAVFPDMTARKAVTFGSRSGVIIVGY